MEVMEVEEVVLLPDLSPPVLSLSLVLIDPDVQVCWRLLPSLEATLQAFDEEDEQEEESLPLSLSNFSSFLLQQFPEAFSEDTASLSTSIAPSMLDERLLFS